MVLIALFDPWPKSSREDLYDRSYELEELHRAIDRRANLILVHGIKRIGKTSILRTFINEVAGICLEPELVKKPRDLEASFAKAIENNIHKISGIVDGLRGVEIVKRSRGVSVRIETSVLGPLWLGNILSDISKRAERFVIAIDNAENIVTPASRNFRTLIAYSLDNLENIAYILAAPSSQALYELLGIDDRSSPLYGRKPHEIRVEKLGKDQSLELLLKGFAEQGVKAPREAEEAAVFFEGVPGWLVYFGRGYLSGKSYGEIVRGAVNIAMKEIRELDNNKILILKALTRGARSVTEIQEYLRRFDVPAPINVVELHILKLEKLGILRGLEIQDPVYREAIKRLEI